MKLPKNTFLSILVLSLLLVLPSFGQEISSILNALQERNTKVEELREKKFNDWKKLYEDLQDISPNKATPGQAGWLSDADALGESLQDSGGNNATLFTEASMLMTEYAYIAGGYYGIKKDSDNKNYLSDYDVPAYLFYKNFSATLINEGAPMFPSAEDRAADSRAPGKWAFKLLVWVGENIESLEYTKKQIEWSGLNNNVEVSETEIDSLNSEQLQQILIEASLHFDRLKVEFVNVNKLDDTGKRANIDNYSDYNLPSFGIINIADLKSLSHAITQLHTIRHPIGVSRMRFASSAAMNDFSYLEGQIHSVDLSSSNLEFEGTSAEFATEQSSPFKYYFLTVPHVGRGDNLNYLSSVGITDEVSTYVEDGLPDRFLFPVWQLDAIEPDTVKTYVSIDCESQECTYGGFQMYNGWEKVLYSSHIAADYRNARFTSGLLESAPNNTSNNELWFTSKTVALWTPNFTNTGLDAWGNLAVASPSNSGQWDVPAYGPYRFVLDLGSGDDLRSAGSLVIGTEHAKDTMYEFGGRTNARSVDLAFPSAIKFNGDIEDFELTYDYSVIDYPASLSEIDDADLPFIVRDFYTRWNQPRLTEIKGSETIAKITYLDVFHLKIDLYYVVEGNQGAKYNSIEIYNETTKNDPLALLDSSDVEKAWRIKESSGQKVTCRLGLHAESSEIDAWKISYSRNGEIGEEIIARQGSFNVELETTSPLKETVETTLLFSGKPDHVASKVDSRLSHAGDATAQSIVTTEYQTASLENYPDVTTEFVKQNSILTRDEVKGESVNERKTWIYDDLGRLTSFDDENRHSDYTLAYDGNQVTQVNAGYTDVTETTTQNSMFDYTTVISADGVESEESHTILYNSTAGVGIKWMPKSVENKQSGIIVKYEYTRGENGELTIVSKTEAAQSTNSFPTLVKTAKTNEYGYAYYSKKMVGPHVLSEITSTVNTPWGQPTVTNDSVTGDSSQITFNEETRQIVSSTNPEGEVTTYKYEDFYNRITERADSVSKTEYTYSKGEEVERLTTGNVVREVTKYFDKDGDLNKTIQTGPDASVYERLDPYGSNKVTQNGRYIITRFDVNGHLLKTEGNVSLETEYVRQASTIEGSEPGDIMETMTSPLETVDHVFDAFQKLKIKRVQNIDGSYTISTYSYENKALYHRLKVTKSTQIKRGDILEPVSRQDITYKSIPHPYQITTKVGIDGDKNGVLYNGDDPNEEDVDSFEASEISIISSNGEVAIRRKENDREIITEMVTGNETIIYPKIIETTVIDEEGNTITRTRKEKNGTKVYSKIVDHFSEDKLLMKRVVTRANGQTFELEYTRGADGEITTNRVEIGNKEYAVSLNDQGLPEGAVTSPSLSANITENSIDNNGSRHFSMEVGDENIQFTQSSDASRMDVSGSSIVDQTVTQEKTQLGIKTKFSYLEGVNKSIEIHSDNLGFLKEFTNIDGAKSQFSLNFRGQVLLQTDANGRTVTYDYDAQDSLSGMHFPASSEDGIEAVSHIYTNNKDGSVATIKDPSGFRIFDWQLGNVTKEEYTTGALAGYKFQRIYDDNGRLKTTTLLKGESVLHNTSMEYLLDSPRITTVTSPDSSATYTYDNAAAFATIASFSRDNIVQTYQRDLFGKINNLTSNIAETSNTAVTYDSSLRIKSFQADSGTWRYNYDSRGQLEKATHNEIGEFHYDVNKQGEREGYGPLSDDDFAIETDDGNRVTSVDLDAATYLNISASPLARIWVNGAEVVNPGAPFKYNINPPGAYPDGGYAAYSILGLIPDGGEEGANNDAQSLIQGTIYAKPSRELYTYDPAGCRKTSKRWNYVYDARKKLVKMFSKAFFTDQSKPGILIEFAYSDEGKRYRKLVTNRTILPDETTVISQSTTWFLYDGWALLYERKESGINDSMGVAPAILERFYTWGANDDGETSGIGDNSALISYREVQGNISEVYLPVYDVLNNVTALVAKSNNAVVAQYQYGPYGELVASSGVKATSNPWRYRARYYDAETELYYFGHRYYEANLGTWLSPEPLGQLVGVNLYAYCKNDPVNKTDFLGLAPVTNDRAIELEKEILQSIISIHQDSKRIYKYSGSSIRAGINKSIQAQRKQLADLQLELTEGRAAVDKLRADARNAQEQIKLKRAKDIHDLVTFKSSPFSNDFVKSSYAAVADTLVDGAYQFGKGTVLLTTLALDHTVGRIGNNGEASDVTGSLNNHYFDDNYKPVQYHELWEINDQQTYNTVSKVTEVGLFVAGLPFPQTWGAKAVTALKYAAKAIRVSATSARRLTLKQVSRLKRGLRGAPNTGGESYLYRGTTREFKGSLDESFTSTDPGVAYAYALQAQRQYGGTGIIYAIPQSKVAGKVLDSPFSLPHDLEKVLDINPSAIPGISSRSLSLDEASGFLKKSGIHYDPNVSDLPSLDQSLRFRLQDGNSATQSQLKGFNGLLGL